MDSELSLTGLAERINAEHAASLASAQDTLRRAIKVGQLLMEAKVAVGHGKFGEWIKQNCSFKPRMAQCYMQAFHNRTQIEAKMRNGSAHLGGVQGDVINNACDQPKRLPSPLPTEFRRPHASAKVEPKALTVSLAAGSPAVAPLHCPIDPAAAVVAPAPAPPIDDKPMMDPASMATATGNQLPAEHDSSSDTKPLYVGILLVGLTNPPVAAVLYLQSDSGLAEVFLDLSRARRLRDDLDNAISELEAANEMLNLDCDSDLPPCDSGLPPYDVNGPLDDDF